MSDALAELTTEIRARVGALGYDLVDLRKRGSGRRVWLQIRVDRRDSQPGQGITVEECAAVSRSLEAWLDSEQILGPRYVLEVSSPGIERPVRWREHWERFIGRQVNVQVEGRHRMRATIVRVADDDVVTLRPEGADEDLPVPLDRIREATLVVDWSSVGRATSERTSH
ncbi:MAG: ribosome maturation factor RimP [Gemmatimonadales bacterium]|nr:ribosome maturation factor RimP [Gemmatimonadales bacterium]NIN50182.1 ribosome maturation factor RimP [Gemmatimonadales bacterium]NIP07646.1 ribosome maturation factor RimP [Gemmatimonadales bacterium]NIR01798.1 ribosome maturation factor RimP [Gemmatimonadales bacterium]NIS65701.1 ribosome maturation factor RimP [Gemmatimonadales bacterium]